MKLFLIAGARPHFMKMAPIIRRLKAESDPQIAQIGTEEHAGMSPYKKRMIGMNGMV